MIAGQTLDLAFRREQDGFTLDVAWRTGARRLCILGASGSGKSATLRLIAGLDRADAAVLRLNGADLTTRPPYARGIAYVPQNYGLLPHLTVGQQIQFAVGSEAGRAGHWMQRLDLAGLEHRYPAELSLGQQQRVALARGLSRGSRLLLLDEPFSALDAPLRARLRRELAALQQDIDAATILVTHDPAEALRLADEILLLEDGHVLQSGPIEAVFLRPATESAARLLGAQNVAGGRAIAPNRIDIGGVQIAVAGPGLVAGPVGWAVRPDCIRIGATHGEPGYVLEAGSFRGGHRRLTVRVGDAVLQAAANPGEAPVIGPCRVTIDANAIQVWPTGTAS